MVYSRQRYALNHSRLPWLRISWHPPHLTAVGRQDEVGCRFGEGLAGNHVFPRPKPQAAFRPPPPAACPPAAESRHGPQPPQLKVREHQSVARSDCTWPSRWGFGCRFGEGFSREPVATRSPRFFRARSSQAAFCPPPPGASTAWRHAPRLRIAGMDRSLLQLGRQDEGLVAGERFLAGNRGGAS
jgi:hypothetical protein